MRIAYCEDEPAQRSRMELLLRTFAERKRLPLTVEAFSDSAAFLFQYPGSYPFDLIFLDIDLGGMDGMALARQNLPFPDTWLRPAPEAASAYLPLSAPS